MRLQVAACEDKNNNNAKKKKMIWRETPILLPAPVGSRPCHLTPMLNPERTPLLHIHHTDAVVDNLFPSIREDSRVEVVVLGFSTQSRAPPMC